MGCSRRTSTVERKIHLRKYKQREASPILPDSQGKRPQFFPNSQTKGSVPNSSPPRGRSAISCHTPEKYPSETIPASLGQVSSCMTSHEDDVGRLRLGRNGLFARIFDCRKEKYPQKHTNKGKRPQFLPRQSVSMTIGIICPPVCCLT